MRESLIRNLENADHLDMNASQYTAATILRDLGTKNVLARDLDEIFGQAKGDFGDKKLLVRIQLKEEWGRDLPTNCDTNWKDHRYPYQSVQFLLPAPSEQPDPYTQAVMGANEYTHYMLIAGDQRRAVLCPSHVIAASPKGWIAVDGKSEHRQVANVPNWTKKVSFFVLAGGKWIKDTNNIWTEPKAVPMDVDEFLKSL